jgi:site-specific DNA-cytosine methylase
MSSPRGEFYLWHDDNLEVDTDDDKPWATVTYQPTHPMRILDLFSGTHSVANAARPLGHEVVTLDSVLPADIQCDPHQWDHTAYPPGHFDLIAASPPCAGASPARQPNLGQLRRTTGKPGTRAE